MKSYLATSLRQSLIIFIPFLFSFLTGNASSPKNPFTWTVSTENGKILVSCEVPINHYLYADKSSPELFDANNNLLKAESSPEQSIYKDEFGMENRIYGDGKKIWGFSAKGDPPFNVKIKYQGCSKSPFMCYPPSEEEFEINQSEKETKDSSLTQELITDSNKVSTNGENNLIRDSAINGNGFLQNLIMQGGLWLFFAAFIGGILSAFTPCVLPLIPITLAILGAGKDSNRSKSIIRSCLYVSGIVITFTLLASIASFTGKSLSSQIFGNKWIIILFSVLFISLSFSLLGLFELQLPEFLQNKLGTAGGNSSAGAFVMGLFAGFLAVPCTGPVLATLLGVSVLSGNPLFSIFLLASYALGFGVPFIFLGAGAGNLPKSGKYMEIVKSLLAIAIMIISMFGIGIAVPDLKSLLISKLGQNNFYPVLLVLLGFLMGAVHSDSHSPVILLKVMKISGALIVSLGIFISFTSSIPATSKSKIEINWRSNLEDARNESITENKNIFIDFTAEWCGACKEMDAFTFSDSDLINELNNNWIPVRVDCTRNTPQVSKILEQYKIIGLPSIVILNNKGEELFLKTGFLSSKELLAAFKKIKLKNPDS